jgi:hypothetical protein
MRVLDSKPLFMLQLDVANPMPCIQGMAGEPRHRE